jgi:serine/threonine protein phosphatase PrpC
MEFTYSYRTKQGVLASNPSKPNQDRLLIKTKLNNEQSHLFAVADGHGTHGHLVSQFIVTNMANLTETQLQSKKP